MNPRSTSPAESGADSSAGQRVLVWDAPVRVFHWLLALSFAGAWLTSESDGLRLVHVTLGYTLAGLVVFRVLWGLVGTRYARFGDFVRGPSAVARYLGSLLRGRPEHHVGHNPAGAVAVVGMLVLAVAVAASGWATDTGLLGAESFEDVHEAAASLMLALVGVHVAGVLVSSWLHRENLVRAMVTGYKRGRPADAIRSSWRVVAAVVLVAVLGFWWMQWSHAPSGWIGGGSAVSAAHAGSGHDDD